MEYYPRLLEDKIRRLFSHYSVISLVGARQVGKSTLINETFKGLVKTIVFDPVEDIGQARADPELFLQNNPPPVFLDEIQYAPELLSAIKRRVDKNPEKGQYILSGSQNLAVVKNISESLAGRVAILELFPMSLSELERSQNKVSSIEQWVRDDSAIPFVDSTARIPSLYTQIWRGGYPGLIFLPDDLVQNFRHSYMQTYVERDIRTVADVGNLQLFSRFFSILTAQTAQEINPTQLGRELGIDRKTALAWKSIAQATYQWIEVPAFTGNAAKRVSGKHKGYVCDTGFVCYHQRISSPDAIPGHPLFGHLIESWIVLEIMKTVQSWPTQPKFYHYRSHGGAEVDLILEMDGKLFPVEIKSKTRPSKKDCRGFREFKKTYPDMRISNSLIICSVPEPEWIAEDVLAIPWWTL